MKGLKRRLYGLAPGLVKADPSWVRSGHWRPRLGREGGCKRGGGNDVLGFVKTLSPRCMAKFY